MTECIGKGRGKSEERRTNLLMTGKSQNGQAGGERREGGIGMGGVG